MTGRLFFLEASGGHVLSANADGSDLKTIVVEGRKIPDGLAVDVARGRLYWTNMGHPTANDGSILSSDLESVDHLFGELVRPLRAWSLGKQAGQPRRVKDRLGLVEGRP